MGNMLPFIRLAVIALIVSLAGCATPYRWGATSDSEWAGRIGSARFADVVSSLGQPREQMSMAGGETKARWLGRTATLNPDPGSMQDYSIQHTEERPIWRDMLFSKDGVLLQAWFSDQRELANSTAP